MKLKTVAHDAKRVQNKHYVLLKKAIILFRVLIHFYGGKCS